MLVNGCATAPFAIGRGLRQGCHLSLLLFNLVVEALSALLKKASVRGLFIGFFIGQSEVSHIQFADDISIFCGAAESQIKNVVRLLKGFELATGLKLNMQNSKFIEVNVTDEKLEYWASLLNCKIEKLPCQYLGLPLGASKNSFQPGTEPRFEVGGQNIYV
ncbi:hypothetical protein GQ457_17G001830 [Hibiscus cannabinus]